MATYYFRHFGFLLYIVFFWIFEWDSQIVLSMTCWLTVGMFTLFSKLYMFSCSLLQLIPTIEGWTPLLISVRSFRCRFPSSSHVKLVCLYSSSASFVIPWPSFYHLSCPSISCQYSSIFRPAPLCCTYVCAQSLTFVLILISILLMRFWSINFFIYSTALRNLNTEAS